MRSWRFLANGNDGLRASGSRTPISTLASAAALIVSVCFGLSAAAAPARSLPTGPEAGFSAVANPRPQAPNVSTTLAGERGFIRIDPDHPHSFVYDNGERYFPMGDTAYLLIEESEGTIKDFFDARRAQGFNFVRLRALGPSHWPLGGTPDNPRCLPIDQIVANMTKLDDVFTWAAERDMNIELILWGYDPDGGVMLWGDEGLENCWADAVAQFGRERPNLFMVTVANEFERYPSPSNYDYEPSDVDWAKRIAERIQQTDPEHLVGVHPSAWTQYYDEGFQYNGFTTRAPQVVWPLWEGSAVDLFIHQNNSGVHINHGGAYLTYDPITWEGVWYPVEYGAEGWEFEGAGLADSVREDWEHGKPVLNTEFGYQYEPGCEGTPLCRTQQAHSPDATRKKAWAIATAGGYFAAGFSSTWNTTDGVDNWRPEYLAILYRFFTERTEYWRMAPRFDLLDEQHEPYNVLLAAPGVEYVVYFPRGGTNHVELAAGTYELEWLNPRSGEFRSGGGITVAAGESDFTPPYEASQDWVLHLTRTDNIPTPTPTPAPGSTFSDVPPGHWAYNDIERLYRDGFVAGCQATPVRKYCPADPLTRAQAAVFVVRGVRGAGFTPPQPRQSAFADVPQTHWGVEWIEQLWQDGFTAGCATGPLRFCSEAPHTRAEATVFFVRMLRGKDYLPVEPSSLAYTDVALGTWYRKWVGAAYADGLTADCEDLPNRGDDRFRPEEPITRAEAACMMAKAKALP